MSGAEKLDTHVPQSKLPIWPLHLHRMVKVLQVKEDTESIVLWRIISIAYFAILRKSQFANKWLRLSIRQSSLQETIFSLLNMVFQFDLNGVRRNKNTLRTVMFLSQECLKHCYA